MTVQPRAETNGTAVPVDHHTLLRGLTAAQRDLLTRKSDRAGLANLAFHGGLIVLLGGLIAMQVPFWPVLMLPQGVLLVFLFTLLHETSHRTPFMSLWLNKAVAWICGFLIILPPEWFRAFHFAHHRHTNDPDRDPELAAPKPRTLAAYLWHLTGLPVWGSHLRVLLRNAAGRCDDSFVSQRGRGKVAQEARLMLLGYLAVAVVSVGMGGTTVVYVWLVPLLLGQPFLRLYLLAEHGLCPSVPNMFANSRTTRTNGLIRRIAWNMPFHAEHHAYPAVPFHRLPQFHALTRPHLKVTEQGYLRFHRDYLDSLAAKG